MGNESGKARREANKESSVSTPAVPASSTVPVPGIDKTEVKVLPVVDCAEEVRVEDTDSIPERGRCKIKVGEKDALLFRLQGELYAVGANCTHYNAPLINAPLLKDGCSLRCPWHGACFNVKTGDIEDCPGLSSLPSYDVVADGKKSVIVRKKAKASKNPITSETIDRSQKVVIIGTGAAAISCAVALRRENFRGEILLVSKDRYPPYDRIKLTKNMNLSDPSAVMLFKDDFYKENYIELLLNKEVVQIDVSSKSIRLSDGNDISYSKLVIATGSSARNMSLDNSSALAKTIRNIDDAVNIENSASGKEVVVYGGSFIALEAAAYLSKRASSVTVVTKHHFPFKMFGEKIGQMMMNWHKSKGVKFITGVDIVTLNGDFESGLHSVTLSNGNILEATVCVAGVGCTPNTDILLSLGAKLDSRGYVEVDGQMRTGLTDIFAAGDITKAPLFTEENAHINIQHWQMAQKQGQIAASNILGRSETLRSVPYFWTNMFMENFRYAGYCPKVEDIMYHGDVSSRSFVAYFIQGGIVKAVGSMKADPAVSTFANLLRDGRILKASDVGKSPSDWMHTELNV